MPSNNESTVPFSFFRHSNAVGHTDLPVSRGARARAPPHHPRTDFTHSLWMASLQPIGNAFLTTPRRPLDQ
jgi:hypothetical protein